MLLFILLQEDFLGQLCAEQSQVWAAATMLLCWIKPGALGAWDSPHSLINEAWFMAKIKRLFPDWNMLAPDKVEDPLLKVAVNSAEQYSEEVPELQAISRFYKEARKIDMLQQLRDLLRFMLVPNPVAMGHQGNVRCLRLICV